MCCDLRRMLCGLCGKYCEPRRGEAQEEGSVPPIASLNYGRVVSTSAMWRHGAPTHMHVTLIS